MASTLGAFAPARSTAVPGATNVVVQQIDPCAHSGHMLFGYVPLTVEVIRTALAEMK